MHVFAGSNSYIKLKPGVECNSNDKYLGTFSTVEECSDVCKSTPQCKFFVHGTGNSKCYWEKTSSASCPEGWDYDTYDFYQLKITGMYGLVIMFHVNLL